MQQTRLSDSMQNDFSAEFRIASARACLRINGRSKMRWTKTSDEA
jgi:hypothetical protein